MLKIKPSDELFEQINEVSYLISVIKNRHMFFQFTIPDAEANAEIQRLENKFKELTDEFYA